MNAQKKLTWSSLFVSGSIVDLTINMWRAKIGIQGKDLGIENSEEVAKVLYLGRYRLAPETAFEKINEAKRSAMRSWDYYSLHFKPGVRYVPDTTLPKLLAELSEAKRRFDEGVEEFLDNYDKMKAEMMPVIEKAVRDASRSEEAAAEAFVRLSEEYPTAEFVRNKFRMSWSIYAIQGARSKAAAKAAEDEAESVKDVVKGMVYQLREDIGEKLGSILAIINRGGVLQETSVRAALDVIDRVETLNVLGDETLETMTRKLRSAIQAVTPGARVSDKALANLTDIQNALDKSMKDAVKKAEANLMGLGRRKLGV